MLQVFCTTKNTKYTKGILCPLEREIPFYSGGHDSSERCYSPNSKLCALCDLCGAKLLVHVLDRLVD